MISVGLTPIGAFLIGMVIQYIVLVGSGGNLLISNKCFIHCPVEDNAEDIIFSYRLQDEYKLEIILAG